MPVTDLTIPRALILFGEQAWVFITSTTSFLVIWEEQMTPEILFY